MKILITWFPLMDPGGLTNHIEQLGIAFKELGHTVHFVSLMWKDRIGAVKPIERDEVGTFGYPFDQRWGWHFPARMRIPYKGKANMDRWKTVASRYDLIVWEIPVPPVNKSNAGNTDWPELYNLPKSVKQQIITHDGNILANAHINEIIHHINAGVGTPHVCGYEQAELLGLPRFIIGSPQDASNIPEFKPGYWAKRPRRWLSIQTFKRWKRVDDIVRAFPLMDESTIGHIAGGGIEWYYMTSKDKVKPGYLDSKGRKIWDVAIEHGMQYEGWLSNQARDALLLKSRCLIDASWSHKYAKAGDHYNRVAFEAAKMGALPILRTRGSVSNDDGTGPWFSDGKNCVTIPWDATPELFAETVDWALSLPTAQAEAMVEETRAMLRAIDRKEAARHMLNAAFGKLSGARGFASAATRTKPAPEIVNEHRAIMASHFGG